MRAGNGPCVVPVLGYLSWVFIRMNELQIQVNVSNCYRQTHVRSGVASGYLREKNGKK